MHASFIVSISNLTSKIQFNCVYKYKQKLTAVISIYTKIAKAYSIALNKTKNLKINKYIIVWTNKFLVELFKLNYVCKYIKKLSGSIYNYKNIIVNNEKKYI